MNKIKAKVAKIIDNRTLVITAGLDKHVKNGMKFLISSATNSKVKDPDSGEILGEVAVPKIRVEVIRVDDKYAVAETYEFNTINEGGSMGTISKIFEPPKLVKQYKTFEIESNQRKAIEKERSIIQIGDIAEQIDE